MSINTTPKLKGDRKDIILETQIPALEKNKPGKVFKLCLDVMFGQNQWTNLLVPSYGVYAKDDENNNETGPTLLKANVSNTIINYVKDSFETITTTRMARNTFINFLKNTKSRSVNGVGWSILDKTVHMMEFDEAGNCTS